MQKEADFKKYRKYELLINIAKICNTSWDIFPIWVGD